VTETEYRVIESEILEEWLDDDHTCEMIWSVGFRRMPGLVCGEPASIRVRVRHTCGYDALRFFCQQCYEVLSGVHICRQCGELTTVTWEVL